MALMVHSVELVFGLPERKAATCGGRRSVIIVPQSDIRGVSSKCARSTPVLVIHK